MIPVLSEVDFSVGALIDFLSDLVTLVDHNCLALGGTWAKRYLFLALIDLHDRRLKLLMLLMLFHNVGHLLRLRFDHLMFEGFDQVDRRQLFVPGRSRGWLEQHLLVLLFRTTLSVPNCRRSSLVILLAELHGRVEGCLDRARRGFDALEDLARQACDE